VEIVVIHDGVRPFITQEMIEESVRSAIRFGAVVMAIPVKETIKMAHADGTVLKTLDRESLWQIQTPQAFRMNVIKEAYHRATEDRFVGTDDASMVERLGGKVHIVPGSYKNIKITTLEDLMLAHLFLRMEKQSAKDDSASRKGNR
jgi:2-C-methyl-D-erythritol 4-phosphate cytidylyltransferase